MTAIDTHDHHDGHHDHHPRQGHHWESMQQQFEAGKLGMWLFLATEFLLFGGLFVAYSVYRHNHPDLFAWGSQYLDTTWGAINTVVLILSSLTMALAVSAAQLGKRGPLVILLALTFLGGCGFMAIKYKEYAHKFHLNYEWGTRLYEPAPGDDFNTVPPAYVAGQVELAPIDAPLLEDGTPLPVSAVAPPADAPSGLALPVDPDAEHETPHASHTHSPSEPGHEAPSPRTDPNRPANAHIFFGIYFCMTGLHGIHVLIGMTVIAWLGFRAMKGEFGPDYFTPVDLGGLYWHVVDLIWIFLFPLLYLI